MGYACPVCGTPEVDAGHLANHLAFTAISGDAGHEDWLDEHVPGWADMGEEGLAERVVEDAEEVDVEAAFREGVDAPGESEDATSGHGHDADTGDGHGRPDVDDRATPSGLDDEETDAILEEAIEYTRRMESDEAASVPAETDEDETE